MTATTSTNTDAIAAFFDKNPRVQLVNVQYVSLCGVISNRIMPKQSFINAVQERGGMHQAVIDFLLTVDGGINPAIFAHFCHDRGVIKPDVSTLRLYPDSAGLGNTAVVVAEASLFDMDARANLRRLVAEAKEKSQLEFQLGFEIEVVYLKPDQEERFASAGNSIGGIHLASATARSELWPVINETTVALAEAGILVESSHKEYGNSQWEYALPPFAPVESVDAYVFAVETIKNIACKHGLDATVFPVPYPDNGPKPAQEGDEAKKEGGQEEEDSKKERFSRQKNGQHIHVSAKFNGDDGRAESSTWNPDELLSGILSHIPALTAIGLSQIDSYQRVGETTLCTGGYVGWGEHHRDMPVRRMHKNHWEIRINDATSNPYAMAAAIIGAALDRKPLTIAAAPSKFYRFAYSHHTYTIC